VFPSHFNLVLVNLAGCETGFQEVLVEEEDMDSKLEGEAGSQEVLVEEEDMDSTIEVVESLNNDSDSQHIPVHMMATIDF